MSLRYDKMEGIIMFLFRVLLCTFSLSCVCANQLYRDNGLPSQIVELASLDNLHLTYMEVHDDFVNKPRIHYVEEYDKDESYLVRERVYRDSLNLYFRIVVGNDSHCYQYMENGPEHSCTYVPHGSTTTLANVIAFIAEGFQQSEIEFDGHNRLNSLRLLHWKYSPIEGDYTFAFSTQTHTLNHPIEKIVATSKSTGFRVTYSDIKVQIDPQITSKMFQPPAPCFYKQLMPTFSDHTFRY